MSALGILKFIGKVALLIAEVIGFTIGTCEVFILSGWGIGDLLNSKSISTLAIDLFLTLSVSFMFIYFFCPKNARLAVSTICTIIMIGMGIAEFHRYGMNWLPNLISILISLIIGCTIIWRTRKEKTTIYGKKENVILLGKIIGGVLLLLLLLKILIICIF